MTINDIMAANAAHGFQFFGEATMRFFNSIVYPTVYPGNVFVTSERDRGMWWEGRYYAAWDGERRYTVRRMTQDFSIAEVSDFGEYATKAAAQRAARRYSETLTNN